MANVDGQEREKSMCTQSSLQEYCAIFQFFKMTAATILDFQIGEMLLADGAWRTELLHCVKFVTIGHSVAEMLTFFQFARWVVQICPNKSKMADKETSTDALSHCSITSDVTLPLNSLFNHSFYRGFTTATHRCLICQGQFSSQCVINATGLEFVVSYMTALSSL